MTLQIHDSIMKKLTYFHEMHKIPNIIFHGSSGCGKHTIVNQFIHLIYQGDKERIKSFVMYVNCAHGKGIKFIREELKFFAKTHIHSNGGNIFKSIVLLNADKLTIDAQSALRRCIEQFSHTTRFFIIVEDKYKLLKPILSRFCEIYVPEPTYRGNPVHLYTYYLEQTFNMKDHKKKRLEWLRKELQKPLQEKTLMTFCIKLYEKGYSGLDIIQLLEQPNMIHIEGLTELKRHELLFAFHKFRKEFRNEKLLIFFILHFMFLSLDHSLENISFM